MHTTVNDSSDRRVELELSINQPIVVVQMIITGIVYSSKMTFQANKISLCTQNSYNFAHQNNVFDCFY